MSDHPHANGNGDAHLHHEVDRAGLVAQMAHRKADAALKLVEKTHTAVEDVHAAVLDVRKLTLGLHLAVQKLANETFEMRTGVPSSWSRRLFLVAVGATIGAVAGAVSAHFFR